MTDTSVATELAALKRIATTLDNLDDDTRRRALIWLWDRYDPHTGLTADPYPPDDPPTSRPNT
jgi:hypothetical protein